MSELEKLINYSFTNDSLLKEAFTHSSILNKNNYERLELLGDSIINFFTTSFLYKYFDSDNEANLSIKKAQIVNNINLSKISQTLELFKYLKIKSEIDLSDRIHSNIYESLVGAIYLDSNYKNVEQFLSKTLIKNINKLEKYVDFKGPLISYYKKNLINNLIIDTNKCKSNISFVSKIIINNDDYFYGFATNKVRAEQRAALSAFDFIQKRYKLN